MIQTGGTHNEMTGGIVIGPAIMGRDITVTLPAQVPPALSGLPGASPAFTGREVELAELLAMLAPAAAGPATRPGSGSVVVSAVGGMGGVGKTELAVQAAHTALERGWCPGGVLFADLFGYDDDRRRDPSEVLEGMLRALGVPGEHIPAGRDDRVRMYRSILAEFGRQGRRLLVVADNTNTEHQVAMLLPTDGVTAAIVTSRHTLAMLNARLLDLNVLAEHEAVQMLARVIEMGRPGDTRLTDRAGDAVELVRVCGRLPLAVRIVGALLAEDPFLSVAQLTRELGELSPLEGLRYGGDGVAKAFGLSYRSLTGQQQRMLRMLTINPGPDTSMTAAAVLTGLAEPAARQVLKDLARAHLIEQGEVYGRWRMHDLLRQYAAALEDEHADADGREAALGRLLESYLATTRAAAAHLDPTEADPAALGFADREQALEWLDAELPNLTAAVHTAATTHPDIAIRLPLALVHFLEWRRLFNDWIALTEIALEAARRTGDRHREGRALNNLGLALREARRFEEAITACSGAAVIFRETGDRHSEGGALNNLGIALQHMRRFEEAITAHQDAAGIFRETGDRHSEGMALNNLGNALQQVRRFEEAITAHQDAAAIFCETGDRHGEGSALNNLGIALVEVGRFEEAITAYQQDLAICRESGDRHGQALTLENLAIALAEVDRLQEAVAACQEAVVAFGEVGDEYGHAGASETLEWIERRAG